MKVIFAGGGTAGSVMPLISIYSEMQSQYPDTEFLFIGTKKGIPERILLNKYEIVYTSVNCGKLRRYFNIRNISDIILIILGFFQSLIKIFQFKADIIIGAGGYISVPVIWAGWFLRKKILIHQQDIVPSLSNKLTKNLADKITVTFERSLNDYPIEKTVWTGNPVRSDIKSGNKERAYKKFGLNSDLPTILFAGGGTGAASLNFIINQSLPSLVNFTQVLHLTGKGKQVAGIISKHYHQFEFLEDEMSDAYAVADVIISRAGLSVLSEFSILRKPVILVPLPNSHQEQNAEYFGEKGAAIVAYQHNLSPTILVNKIKELLGNTTAQEQLSESIGDIIKENAERSIVNEVIKLVE